MGALVSDPVGLWDTFRDRLAQQREYAVRPPYRCGADPEWETNLYGLLRAMPRNTTGEFRVLWSEVVAGARKAGIDVGPASYAGFNDGDTALVRGIWRLIREMKPDRVVETGVGHGFTSRIILEALARNGKGHLWSIDRPPLDPKTRQRIGIVVDGRHHERWTLIRKSSRRALPDLMRSLGSIDLFIHDSGHTERNVTFELAHAWKALRPGGIAVIDDIDSNWGFDAFVKSHRDFRAIVCEAEPVRPDERRFNRKGLFAIVAKAG
jgi:predicted O-methyltransferase YrrM